MELNQIQSSALNWGEAASSLNQNFSKIGTDMEKMRYATTRNKGYFSSGDALKEAVESAVLGDIAYVKHETLIPYEVWKWTVDGWVGTGTSGGDESISLGDYYNKEDVDTKFGNHKLKIATNEVVGGIIAEEKTEFDVTEVKIDPATGKLYTPGVTVEGDITPDEEDLTATIEEGKAVVRFRDRESIRGKGYLILRSGKSAIEQMTKENTIYEIRYDFDLNGETLEVPVNCVLCFKGGKISNGNIVFNNTAIDALTKIFDNIQYSGKVTNAINVLWFGAKGDASTDDTAAFEAALRCSADYDFNYDSSNPGNTIYIPRGTYVTTRTLYVRKGCILQGESCSNTFIHAKIANTEFAFIMGRKSDNSSDSGGLQPIIDNIFIISSWGSRGIQCTEAGYKISNCWFTCSTGISINGVDGIVENCVSDGGQRFLEIYGKDGTDYYNKSHSIIVKGCITFTGYGAINLLGAYGVVISNCAFYYSSNQSIEVYKNSGNIIIDSCDFRTSADPSYYNSESSHIRTTNGALIDSVITNCTFSKSRKYDIYLGRGYNNMISNCLFKDGAARSIWLVGTSNIKVSNNMFVNYPSQPLIIQAPTHINDNVFKNCITSSPTNEYENTCIKVEQAASSGCIITNNVCDTEGAYVVTFTTSSIDNISRGNISKKHTYDSYAYSGSGGSFENERTWTNSTLAKVHKRTYARPSLSETDSGFIFYETNLTPPKLILWNGSAWVNLDGTALTTTSEE